MARVLVPAASGAYLVSGVNIPSATDVDVESGATIKKFGTSSGPLFTMQGTLNTSFANDISIQGVNGRFTIDLRDAGSSTTGIRLRSVKNFAIKHIVFLNNSDPSASGTATLKPNISFLPKDTSKLGGEFEHPIGGQVADAHAYGANDGWGLIQLTGAENVHFANISSEGGVALRLENFENNATTVDGITADGVACENGKNAVQMNPHNADNGTVSVHNVTSTSCQEGIRLSDDAAYPEGNFDPSTIDTGSVTAGESAQLPDAGGAWHYGSSQNCVDAVANLTWTPPTITNLSCGGLPNNNWPQ